MAPGIPRGTLLVDLDESLRRLVAGGLNRKGREGPDAVHVAFEAPDAAWAATAPRPAVNVFLYALREAAARRVADWSTPAGGSRGLRPALPLEVSYAVTAWAGSARDEHGLLSELLTILHAHRVLPADVLSGALGGDPAPALETAVARTDEDLTARLLRLTGGAKAALRYTILVAVEAADLERGPEVMTVQARVDGSGGAPSR